MLGKKSILAFAVSALSLLPHLGHASSFQILEQSPALLGQGFAGTASTAEDATTVFFNPAALNQIKQNTISVGVNGIFTEAKFYNDGSNTNGVTGKTDEIGIVPNAYIVYPFREGVTFGFGVNAPFGLASEYKDDWIGRYIGTFSELEVINANAVIALQLNDYWSLGVGINYQAAEVTLESKVDSTFGINPQPNTDSHARIKGDDEAITADLSLFYSPSLRTKFGLVWRQGANFDLKGSAKFTNNAVCAPGLGYPTGATPSPTTGTICAATLQSFGGNVTAELSLPDTVTLSGSHQVNDYWWIHADIAWTEWSEIQQVDIVNVQSGSTINQLDLRYDDTMRYALGASYKPSKQWTWRMGIAQDEAPNTDSHYVTPRVPDQDRTWFTLGFNYEFNPRTSLDLGYAYLKVDTPHIENLNPTTGHYVKGKFKSNVNILGVQANWRF